MTTKYFLSAAVAFTLLIAAAPAHGAFIATTLGNTNAGVYSGNGVDGTVNFAVLDKTGGTGGDTFNTGVAGFDSNLSATNLADTYLYLYQITNNSAPGPG